MKCLALTSHAANIAFICLFDVSTVGNFRPLHGEESDSRTFSSSSSEPDDISTAIVPIITSEAVSTVTIVT
ncbi:hypothetical protein Y032_0002g980 [Ancylostoma ceylanicum]|uniref:Uncharacterized protein n=1 Tax=Ancylostoma ceylanicum TaxID=53326 RepID=A0A016W438_9BILA|nr:hypothetical protein Y032_0002g980 [Ancylostoma ceylanicum]